MPLRSLILRTPGNVANQAMQRHGRACEEDRNGAWAHMLWTIFVVMLILWLLGFSLHIGGGLIHILLVIAVVVLIFNLVSGSRRAA